MTQHKTPYIVGFNGPPRCGKDSIANALQAMVEMRHGIPTLRVALSQPMREIVYTLLGRKYSAQDYEEIKDEQQPLFGCSIREAMIRLSEKHIKPEYGQDFWARRVVDMNDRWWGESPALVLVSDIGFQSECDVFDTNGTFLNVRVSRPGIGWANDSRGYCMSQQMLVVDNDRTVREAAEEVYLLLANKSDRWNLD